MAAEEMFTCSYEDYKPELTRMAVKLLRAYLECSDEIQASIRDMLAIVNSPDADEDDRQMALGTIAEALFPVYHDGELGVNLEDVDKLALHYQRDGETASAELDHEEQTFADRLRKLIEEKRLTQARLAERAGVGQPAISMMLARKCRPQQRTIEKLASALGVDRRELWPPTA